MSVPTSRQEFADYCLRKLGAPVIEIEVDDDQLDDRIDEALKYYMDFHYDGSEKTYFKYQVDQNFIDTKTITLPANIIGVTNIYNAGGFTSTKSMFDIRYQIALNDLYTLTNVSIVPYYTAFQYIQLLEQVLVGQAPLYFSRHKNEIRVDTGSDNLEIGDYFIIEVYQYLDPDTYTAVWGDRWLARYATCLIKEQWGTNLKKYGKVQIIAGTVFNGQEIYDEANAEKMEMENDVTKNYGVVLPIYLG